jgi:hypothetical protein
MMLYKHLLFVMDSLGPIWSLDSRVDINNGFCLGEIMSRQALASLIVRAGIGVATALLTLGVSFFDDRLALVLLRDQCT